jgi:hypothetical protein
MGHLFNRCPLVDDRLRKLLWEEVMNVHQPILPTTTTIVPNVFVPPTYIPYFIGNQFPTMVQPMTNKDRQHVQQLVNAPFLTTIQVSTKFPTYVPRGFTHQPLD